MSEYKYKRTGYYYRKGRWHPSKKTKNARRQKRLDQEISAEIAANPAKYPYKTFVTSASAAKLNGYEVWWGKCKKGHLTERQATETGCPICKRVSRHARDMRIKAGSVNLSKEDQCRLDEIYEEARRLTREMGIKHHVDHIRPLAAGGVHHPENLQILTAQDNLSKGNLFDGKRQVYSKKERQEIRNQIEAAIEEKRIETHRLLFESKALKVANRRLKNRIVWATLLATGFALWLKFKW